MMESSRLPFQRQAAQHLESRFWQQIRKDLKGYLFVLPWMISLLAFTAYPVLASFYFSFNDYSVLNPPKWVGLEQFVTMFTKDPLYWKSVSNSAYYALLAVPLQLIVALALATLLNRQLKGIGVFRTIYYLPSLVPSVVVTLQWMFLLDPRNGVVNSLLRWLGLPGLGWLRSALWAKPSLVLMSVWAASGWQMLIFLAALKEIPHVFHEAAMVDGANTWQRFRKVTLPLITPAILFNLVIGVIDSFQVFALAYVAAGTAGGVAQASAGPLNSLLMYMLLLYRYGFRYFQMGYASAMALALFAALVAITALLMRSSGRWVYYEGSVRR
jgi:multiple sugar transport system permease protein